MPTPNRDPSQTKYSVQNIANTSFDEDFGVQTNEILGFDDGGNVLRRVATNTDGRIEVDIAADSVGIGGGTQYTEDAVAAADPQGNAQILVREDSPVAIAADGDNVALRGTQYGAAYAQIVDSSGNFVDSFGGGTQYAVDDALGATPTGTLAIAIRDDALSTLTPIEGDGVGLRTNSTGALWVIPSGTVTVTGDAGGSLTIDNSDLSTLAASLYVEDDAAAANPNGNVNILVRTDTPATQTSTDGDNIAQRGTNYGAAYVQVVDSSGSYVDSFGGGTQYAVDTALGATPTGTLAVAIRDDALSALTPVEGDAIGLRTDANGALWVIPSGTVTVDGSGVTQPISGTITANLSATDNAVLDTIDAVLDTINAKLVTGTDIGDVTINNAAGASAVNIQDGGNIITVDGTVTANLSATDNTVLDNIDSDTSNIQTAVQLIDDAIIADDAAFIPATTKVMMAGFEFDDTTPDSVNEGDGGAARMSSRREVYMQIRDASGNERGLDVDANGDIGTTLTSSSLDLMLGTDFSNVLGTAALTDGSNHLQVDIAADSVGIGGGTQYTEDAAAAANPVGNAQIYVRQDTPAALTTTDGDNVAGRATDYGAQYVQVVTSSGSFVDSFGGSGGTSHNDDAAFTIGGSSNITPTGYLADETTPDSVDEGDVGVPRMSLNRIPYSILRDAAGNERGVNVDASNRLTVLADLGATDNAVLDTIDAVLDTINAKLVTGTVIGDVNLGATDNAVLDSIDTSASGILADTAAIQTAVEIIDNAVYVDDADWTDSTSSHLLVGGIYQSAPQSITDGDTGPLQVDVNGKVIESNSAAILADTANMDTNLGTVAGAVSAGQMQVDIVADGAGLLTNTTFNAAFGTAGSADSQVMSIQGIASMTPVVVDLSTNNDVTVDGSVAHDGLDSGGGGPVKIGGRAQTSEAQPEEVADNDRVDALFDRNGYLRVRGDFDPSFADINDSTSGDNTIIAAQAAGKRIAVWAFYLISDGTVDARWEDGAAGTAFTGQMSFQAREGISVSAGGVVPLFVGSAATLLNLELSAAVNVHGGVSYTVIDD